MTKRSQRKKPFGMYRGWTIGWLAVAGWLAAFVGFALVYAAVIALLAFLRYPSAVWACELVRMC